ncbi:hypothetical protein N7472_007567 [Penicillium cf. griseofulvum]|uniref:Uncharacterized protein n=1 Tax=Penicillium cf. griseofulvum TaxID=2972120 RepID=A0A9W9J247_9EURO|nr:hypothetical protein N7472_007567 [Penicillium cf. griseofulvum]KAJ5452109.1 hypothetical protein N7445_000292 [Penicillium cf. griseofulvum]
MPYSLTTHDMPRQPTMLPRNPVTPPSSISHHQGPCLMNLAGMLFVPMLNMAEHSLLFGQANIGQHGN